MTNEAAAGRMFMKKVPNRLFISSEGSRCVINRQGSPSLFECSIPREIKERESAGESERQKGDSSEYTQSQERPKSSTPITPG